MNKIYTGKFLEICYEEKNSLFIQEWILPPTKDDFKFEMLAYTKLYKKHKPIHTLWLQQNFSLNIDNQTKNWIEKNVNEPCLSFGNKKCAFVVSKDVLIHVSVMNSFDKIESCIIPRHFASEKEARKWLKNDDTLKIKKEQRISYEGIDENGNVIIKIPTNDIKNTFKNIHQSIEQELFVEKNEHKLNALTKREKEIFKLISNGYSSKDIALKLYIETSTVSTHRKKIIKKLNIESSIDWFLIAKAFNFLD